MNRHAAQSPTPDTLIYFIQAGDDGPIKIGITTCLKRRLAQLQKTSHRALRVLTTMPGDREIEKVLHEGFAICRLCGEWFEPHGALLEFIKDLL